MFLPNGQWISNECASVVKLENITCNSTRPIDVTIIFALMEFVIWISKPMEYANLNIKSLERHVIHSSMILSCHIFLFLCFFVYFYVLTNFNNVKYGYHLFSSPRLAKMMQNKGLQGYTY